MDGGYAEYVAAYARHVVKVPGGVDSLDAAPLRCAGVTVYKAVKSSEVGPSQLLRSSVSAARATWLCNTPRSWARPWSLSAWRTTSWRWRGNSAPITWSTLPSRIPRQRSRSWAAPTPRSPSPSLRGSFEQAFDSLARGGTLMMAALPEDNYVKLPIFETVLKGINIKGSIVGTHRDVEDVF